MIITHTTQKNQVDKMIENNKRWEQLNETLQDMAFFVYTDLPLLFYSPAFYSKDLLNYLFIHGVITKTEAKFIRAVMTARNASKSDWATVQELYDTKISKYFRDKIEEAENK